MTQMKSSTSFSPMTFREYISNIFTKCSQKDNNSWGWFVDIETPCKTNSFQQFLQRGWNDFAYNNSMPLKTKKSYMDMSNDLLFMMEEDKEGIYNKPTIYKKISYNIIGIMFIAVIYVILL